MPTFRAAIIGTGRPKQKEGNTGAAICYKHAAGYKATKDLEIAAVADIRRENAEAFVADFPGPKIYTDYKEMVAKEKPDIVSVCLWPGLHCPVTMDLIGMGVRAIHCEKPIAPTFGESRRMVEAAVKAGVQLTFNHQRRFGSAFKEAKRRLDAGEIGELVRLEGSCTNMFDWGTHWFDMMFFYNNQTPVEWVIGQIDVRTDKGIFGVRLDDQGISNFRFANGVMGLLATGESAKLVGAQNRLIGKKGVIEVGGAESKGAQAVRVWREGTTGWETSAGTIHGEDAFVAAIQDVVDCARTGRRSLLDCRHAIMATELIFATYESSRRRARIDLPLTIEDSPLLSMIASGEIGKR